MSWGEKSLVDVTYVIRKHDKEQTKTRLANADN